jgi:sugar phosphate isomerase/epimerase
MQLYAVRGAFAADVPGTLAKLAEIGYQGVEFWGYGGTPNVYQKHDAKALRKMLDARKLKCCGIHCQLKALQGENLQRTIDNNKILGNKFLIVAANKRGMESEASIKKFAAFLNQTAASCKRQGMRVGYHAHPFDFVKIGGKPAWEVLFSSTAPDVIMQLDIGNCLGGGGDPIAMLKKFPGRATTVHIKEHGEKTLTSDYFKEVFKLCERPRQPKWYIVEMGGPGGKDFEVPRRALTTLHKLGK